MSDRRPNNRQETAKNNGPLLWPSQNAMSNRKAQTTGIDGLLGRIDPELLQAAIDEAGSYEALVANTAEKIGRVLHQYHRAI